MQNTTTKNDVYGRTDELNEQTIEAIAQRLEARSASSRFMAMQHEYLDAIDLPNASSVLAIGCGTGVEVRTLVSRQDFQGKVTAVDLSDRLIAKAVELADQEGLSSDITWLVGNAQSLDELPDNSFDLVIAHTLISHVGDPEAVVKESARVAKPGGTVVFFDGDYATLTFGTDDPEYGRQMDEKIIQAVIANPRVMRRMPRMLKRAGLELVGHHNWALSEVGKADFFLGSLESFRTLIPSAGVTTAEKVNEFVDDQLKAHEEGTFFSCYNFYAMVARS